MFQKLIFEREKCQRCARVLAGRVGGDAGGRADGSWRLVCSHGNHAALPQRRPCGQQQQARLRQKPRSLPVPSDQGAGRQVGYRCPQGFTVSMRCSLLVTCKVFNTILQLLKVLEVLKLCCMLRFYKTYYVKVFQEYKS